MNEILTQVWSGVPWALILAVVWVGSNIEKAIQQGNTERRDANRNIEDELRSIDNHVFNLEIMVDGLSKRYDPPDLSEYGNPIPFIEDDD